jgi:hypothetical protein
MCLQTLSSSKLSNFLLFHLFCEGFIFQAKMMAENQIGRRGEVPFMFMSIWQVFIGSLDTCLDLLTFSVKKQPAVLKKIRLDASRLVTMAKKMFVLFFTTIVPWLKSVKHNVFGGLCRITNSQ